MNWIFAFFKTLGEWGLALLAIGSFFGAVYLVLKFAHVAIVGFFLLLFVCNVVAEKRKIDLETKPKKGINA